MKINSSKPPIIPSPQYNGTILGVSINKSYGKASILHCAEEEWRASKKRVDNLKYLLAAHDETIVGVFEVIQNSTNITTGRIVFKLDYADFSIQEKYLGRKVQRNSHRNPIFYI